MGKYLLKKFVIIETLMMGIVSLFIVMNYFSNNTIWDLIFMMNMKTYYFMKIGMQHQKQKYKYMKNGVCHCLIDISV